jgi:hypothetical protein
MVYFAAHFETSHVHIQVKQALPADCASAYIYTGRKYQKNSSMQRRYTNSTLDFTRDSKQQFGSNRATNRANLLEQMTALWSLSKQQEDKVAAS